MPSVGEVPYRPSTPLRHWRGPRRALLASLAAGALSQPLVEAYVIRAVAEFQAFARDLHDLGTRTLVELAGTAPSHHQPLVHAATAGRQLDRSNPSMDNLALDFGRLGVTRLRRRLSGGAPRSRDLRRFEQAISLRNALAHGDDGGVHRATRDGASVTTAWMRPTVAALDRLAEAIDVLLWDHLSTTFGRDPW